SQNMRRSRRSGSGCRLKRPKGSSPRVEGRHHGAHPGDPASGSRIRLRSDLRQPRVAGGMPVMLPFLKRVGLTAAGVLLILLGVVLLVLPGPGLLLIAAGLGLLATEFPVV